MVRQRKWSLSSATGDASEMIGGAGRMLPHLLLLQGPSGLDRIQIGRVGRQIQHANPVLMTRRLHASIVMRAEVVHHQDIATLQFRQ